jgi:urea transport system substrate-binding protein
MLTDLLRANAARFRCLISATAGVALALTSWGAAKAADDAIKVGVIHSLSGTMAISEVTLKDTVLMMIDQQNKKGGVIGKRLEAVVVDPASDGPLFAEKARELIAKDKVSVLFGGWTSISRRAMSPVVKELNSILFYPVQFEGEESERNVFYTGAAPNQQAIPAVDYLMNDEKIKRWVLAGTDYVYPRTTNKILEAYLKSKGVRSEDIMINYTPFGHSDWQPIIADVKKFASAGLKTAVISTVNGDANVPSYKEFGNQGIKATDVTILALSMGEEELAGMDTKPMVGHLAAWNYFESIKTPANVKFIRDWQAYTRNPKRVTNDPMEATYIGFNMWVKAVEAAKSFDPDKVIAALPGTRTPNLTGGLSEMLPNHYITKPVFIGEIKANGQFDVVWKTPGLIAADAWSKQLPGRDLIADWRPGVNCGTFNTVTHSCGAGSSSPLPAVVASSNVVPPTPSPPGPPPVVAAPAPAPPPQVVTASPADQPALPPVLQAPRIDPGRRVALVIGNSAYKNAPLLPNPARDAVAVGKAFRDLGFQKVTVQTDLTREGLFNALSAFSNDSINADWAVVYFAGHGMEMGGVNYLIPTDAKLQTDRAVTFETIPLEQVMSAVDGARKLRLILLDACRVNPFDSQMSRTVATRSVERGFARVEPDPGTLVVYAAKAGQTAMDGDGVDSPFVTALLTRMRQPNLEVRRLFDLVRDDVMTATRRQQQPFSYGSVSGSEDFYFVAGK